MQMGGGSMATCMRITRQERKDHARPAAIHTCLDHNGKRVGLIICLDPTKDEASDG